MAIKRFIGLAAAVKQVTTITITGTIVAGDTFTVFCGNAKVVATATDTSTSTTAALIQAALASKDASPEFSDAKWTVATNVVTGTGAVPGVPFVVTASTSGSATVSVSTTTACSGPNFWNVAANWSGGSMPSASDTVVIEAGSESILYGLTGTATSFGAVIVEDGFSNSIGLPEINSKGFHEYRATYLDMTTTALTIGGTGRGSSLMKINLNSAATAVVVYGTGQGTTNEPALQLTGGSSATLYVANGQVAVASRATETANFTSISTGANANVSIGRGTTVTTVTSLGNTFVECSVTNLNVRGNTTTTLAQVTTLDVNAGRALYQSSQTITTAYVGPGVLDCSDLRTRTITTLNMRSGGKLIDPQQTCTVGTLAMASGVKGLSAE